MLGSRSSITKFTFGSTSRIDVGQVQIVHSSADGSSSSGMALAPLTWR